MAMHSHPTEVVMRIMLTLWTIARLITCSKGNNCRCSDSNVACWPTQEQWNSFNVTLDGRLIAPKPTGKPTSSSSSALYVHVLAKLHHDWFFKLMIYP